MEGYAAPNLRTNAGSGAFALENRIENFQRSPAPRNTNGPVVACVQMEPRVGEKHENVARSLRYIEEAAKNGAALVVLPELANTGYVFADREEAFALAEDLPNGETVQIWADAAQRLGVHIVAGVAEREGKRLYNSAVCVGPSGHIGTYQAPPLEQRKRLLRTG